MTIMQSIRALSLDERQAQGLSVDPADLPATAAQEAERFVRWWERTCFPGDPRLFTRRLRSQGLNRSSVRSFLSTGRPVGPGGADDMPAWWDRWPLDHPDRAAAEDPSRPITFHVAFRSFVHRAWAQVDEAVDAAARVRPELTIDRDALRESFRDHLNDRLTLVAAQAFTTWLHVARLSRRLGAGDAVARFEKWVQDDLGDPAALRRLLAEYPVLARAFVSVAEGTTAAWSELVVRLAQDWPEFPDRLGAPLGGDSLVGVSAGMGDTHRGGRCVMSLEFASGWRVVYKPRPMVADAHFQDLVRWMGERGFEPALRTVAVLDRRDHGWMELLSNESCLDEAQVEAFYRRQGGLLLLLHLLDATDIHSENLIAAGEHPVPVDLETLFQARPSEPPGTPEPATVRIRVFHSLVLRTLMLPLPSAGTVGTLDVAGLTDVAGQKSSFRVPSWVDPNTDRMRLVHRQIDLQGDKNLPRLGDRVVLATGYADAIVAGFTAAYRLAMRHRDELAAEDGPLLAFRDDRIRYLVRPTIEYSLLLDGSYHPSCLKDAVQRDLVFDGLWRSTRANPYRERAIASERQDLWNEDVPYFSTTVAGRDLVDSRGHVIPDFLPESGLGRALTRLAGFSPADLERQVACIRGALATAVPRVTIPPMRVESEEEATPRELVEAASRVGERLLTLASREEGQAHWTGAVLVQGRMMWSPVGPDLYNGTAGIALFLAHLARATGRREFDDTARAAYLDTPNYLRSPALEPSIGAFAGVSGLLYTALHLSALWDDPAVADDALRALHRVARQVRRDTDMDLLDGSAGCILVMLRLARRFPESSALDIATACGHHLLRHAVRVDDALAWTSTWAGRPLLGLSHGSSGIAWALAELASDTGDRRFLNAARRALAYEQRHFDAGAGNWPDFRPEAVAAGPEAPRAAVAWCHGAPGVGLARLMTRGHGLDDAALDADVAVALETTSAYGFGSSHCLCHGDLGNAELLSLASEAYGDGAWRSRALRRAKAVLLDERQIGGWRCTARDLRETPGLMGGLAGIGYGLLRLANPSSVPSVLALEGPR